MQSADDAGNAPQILEQRVGERRDSVKKSGTADSAPPSASRMPICHGISSHCKPSVQPARIATTPAARTVLDPTKGKQGGKIVIQQYGDPGGGLELVKIRNPGTYQFAGFTHDGLLEFTEKKYIATDW